MQSLENLVGQLQLALHYVSDAGLCRVSAVNLHSNRLRMNAHFLAGKPIELAPKLTGMLFSLCGTAQSIASARACEQATRTAADAATEQQREVQVGIETLFEHLLRLSQEWPAALGNEPVSAQELQALFKLKRELLQVPNPAVVDDVQYWFEHRLLGLPTARWLDYCTRGDVKKLSIRGKIGNLMTSLCRHDWEHLGHCTVNPLPELPREWWLEQLAASDAAEFSAQPTVAGQACETSSLTRQWDNPALAFWQKKYRNGLMTRLIARVLDMLETWTHVVSSIERAPPVPVPVVAPDGLEGMAVLPTARGLLVHRVVQVDGLICTYQIVAPTEWNFHPQGSLHQMLSSLYAKNAMELRVKAQALITALDPCVAYQLEIHHA